MSPILRNPAFIAAVVALAAGPVANALAAPSGSVPAPRAEVQVELCTPFSDIERSLKLRPDGDPIEVWLFDDAALTLFERVCALSDIDALVSDAAPARRLAASLKRAGVKLVVAAD